MLDCIYLDIDEMLYFEILNHQDVELSQAGKALREIQQNCIKRANEYKNCILTIPNELFIANDNFKLFNENIKIFIALSKSYFVARAQSNDKYKLEQQLSLFNQVNMFVKNNCNYIIDKEAKSVEQICQDIFLMLKQKKSH